MPDSCWRKRKNSGNFLGCSINCCRQGNRADVGGMVKKRWIKNVDNDSDVENFVVICAKDLLFFHRAYRKVAENHRVMEKNIKICVDEKQLCDIINLCQESVSTQRLGEEAIPSCFCASEIEHILNILE